MLEIRLDRPAKAHTPCELATEIGRGTPRFGMGMVGMDGRANVDKGIKLYLYVAHPQGSSIHQLMVPDCWIVGINL